MSSKPVARTKDGREVISCLMPRPVPDAEAQMYQRFHAMHCERRGEEHHRCAGRVTVDANGVTMSCPLCGDSRKTYSQKEGVDA